MGYDLRATCTLQSSQTYTEILCSNVSRKVAKATMRRILERCMGRTPWRYRVTKHKMKVPKPLLKKMIKIPSVCERTGRLIPKQQYCACGCRKFHRKTKRR